MGSPRLLMCPPAFFQVSYAINPWMSPASWQLRADEWREAAARGWDELVGTYRGLGAEVVEMPAAPDLPDLVFTANAGFVLDGTALLARFKFPERRGEEAVNAGYFATLVRDGLLRRLVTLPPDCRFEGAGDALWDAHRGMVWCGFGQRSDHAASEAIARIFGVRTMALELVDPRYYHLDTCLAVLPRGHLAIHAGAFTAASVAAMREIVGAERLIIVAAEDAVQLAVNCVGFADGSVVLGAAATRFAGTLRALGYRPIIVDLAAFRQSGGSACCLTLRLDDRGQGHATGA